LNVHAPSKGRSDDSKDSFYGKLERSFFPLHKYNTIILKGDFNAKLGKDDIFTQAIENRV